MAGNLAPTPNYPEQVGVHYESNHTTPTPGRRGPYRFQEGLVTDRNVPDGFMIGAGQGYATGPHDTNASVYIKTAQETMSERAHAGSASWTESPSFLGEFGHGVSPAGEIRYELTRRDGGHYQRPSPTVVRD